MGSTELNPIELMVAVIRDHSPESIWTGSPLEGYRRVGNTNRGEIGEDFVVLCLGICLRQIVFEAWRKGSVAEGDAGTLVRMAEGQSITFKLTKKLDDLRSIEEFVPWVRTTLEKDTHG